MKAVLVAICCFAFGFSADAQTSYDAVKDFSVDSNPNGTWSYGTSATLGSAFIPQTTGESDFLPGLDRWYSPAIDTTVQAVKNRTGYNVVGNPATYYYPANMLWMHPLPGRDNIVRWTAPTSGTFLFQGKFAGLDNVIGVADTDVHILRNSATDLLPGTVLLGLGTQKTFSFSLLVNSGDTFDFVVGNGPSGVLQNDSTGLRVTITSVVPSVLLVSSGDTHDIRKFDGTTGSPLGVFATGSGLNLPQQTVAGPDGNLYVADAQADAVLRYDGASGAALPSPGNAGATFIPPGSGGLVQPLGIAFGPDGNLYVGDHAANVIRRYSGTTGVPIGTGVFANSADLNLPNAIVFGSDGNLYVSNGAGNNVLRFNGSTGAPLPSAGNAGAQFAATAGFNGPTGLLFGPNGDLYVASAGPYTSRPQTIYRFSGDTGSFTDAFSDSSLGRPVGMTIGTDGKLYVASIDANAIERFDILAETFSDFFVPSNNNGGMASMDYLMFLPMTTPVTGTINVTTNLPSATFTITGPTTYTGSGTSFNEPNAPAGKYVLHFNSVLGYITPPDQTQILIAGSTLTFDPGVYSPITLSVCSVTPLGCSQSLFFVYQQGVAGPVPPQQISVTSNASALSISLQTTSDSSGWLAVTAPPDPSTPVNIGANVTVDNHLKAGKYFGQISVTGAGATNSPVTIPVVLTVTAGPALPKPAVVIIPGIFGTKLATSDHIVWLSNHTINDSVVLKHDLDSLKYDAAGQSPINLSVHAQTQNGDFGDLFNLYSWKGNALYALDCGTVLATIADWTGAQCNSHLYVYNALRAHLQSQNFPVFTFPYDWRRDISEISNDLFSFIQTLRGEGYSRIALVAHSMGGLVVEQVLANHGNEIGSSLQTIITMGTPFRGSVQTYLYFQGWGPPLIPDVVSATDLQRIGSNWNSSYELLPRDDFASVDGAIQKINAVYSGTQVGAVLPRQDALIAAYTQWLTKLPQIPNAYAIIGTGQQTPVAVTVSTAEYCRRAVLGDGDGTVPLKSAQGSSWIDSSRTWYVSATHSEIPDNAQVITAVTQLLSGKNPTNLSSVPLGAKAGLLGCF